MSSPPPPYSSLQSPPAYPYSRKLPTCPPRQSSRQTLSNALQRARHAVQLDSSGLKSNIPSAVTAYGEAIELLQSVIARRSQRPGNEAEVERVMVIHDRYVHRVRELCRARRLPLPSHVADAPSTSRHPLRDPPPDEDAVSPMSAEWDADLSSLLLSSSSSSMTGDMLSSPSSVRSADHHHHQHHSRCHEWIVSEACDEELKEWGQFLNENAADRRASVATSASSAVWSTIAISHG